MTERAVILVHVSLHLTPHPLPVPASRNEYQTIRLQLESETFPPERPGDKMKSFHSLPPLEQSQLEKKRLAGKPCEVGCRVWPSIRCC